MGDILGAVVDFAKQVAEVEVSGTQVTALMAIALLIGPPLLSYLLRYPGASLFMALSAAAASVACGYESDTHRWYAILAIPVFVLVALPLNHALEWLLCKFGNTRSTHRGD